MSVLQRSGEGGGGHMGQGQQKDRSGESTPNTHTMLGDVPGGMQCPRVGGRLGKPVKM